MSQLLTLLPSLPQKFKSASSFLLYCCGSIAGNYLISCLALRSVPKLEVFQYYFDSFFITERSTQIKITCNKKDGLIDE